MWACNFLLFYLAFRVTSSLQKARVATGRVCVCSQVDSSEAASFLVDGGGWGRLPGGAGRCCAQRQVSGVQFLTPSGALWGDAAHLQNDSKLSPGLWSFHSALDPSQGDGFCFLESFHLFHALLVQLYLLRPEVAPADAALEKRRVGLGVLWAAWFLLCSWPPLGLHLLAKQVSCL